MLNLQYGRNLTLLDLHRRVTIADIITINSGHIYCIDLEEKMIKILQGIMKKWITSATQTGDRKGKARAMERDLPWHDADNDSDDGVCNDNDNSDTHMEAINLAEPRMSHLGDTSGDVPMELRRPRTCCAWLPYLLCL